MTDIPVNPELPEGFEETPNDVRPESHDVWWYRPFIETDDYETFWQDTYSDYKKRMEKYGHKVDSEEAYNQKHEEQRSIWFNYYPTGRRYNVRCLDGGAWDRSTNHGFYGSLEEAEAKARELIDSAEETKAKYKPYLDIQKGIYNPEDWLEDTNSKIKA